MRVRSDLDDTAGRRPRDRGGRPRARSPVSLVSRAGPVPVTSATMGP
ncbi:MAG: hypothetical protein AVDCRST_MAG60-1942 [uncultured Nocardioides sp.]|uniref:Uncharacterized protein n=1 Tax=uncultured Nocardioides sp. TaxID=198441 RepID=A0A6J4NVT4_9ACTN|nr:MAG: hypothetical protein AVDCRST_MAG60-1942 [uncultured Nocardioides sp.]